MLALTLAALAWIGWHVGIAGTAVRGTLARRLGENGFRGVFSLASVLLIALLAMAYRAAPEVPLWVAPSWLRWMLVAAMLPAFVLFGGAILVRSPTAMGGDAALQREPAGILRVTRHPMLWSFALWALVHVLGNGDAASLLFFGAFGVTALAGMPSIDAKLAARDPAGWQRFAAGTSIVPFAAVMAGRTRLQAAAVGPVAPLLGLALWALLLWAHPLLFGVSPLPG